MQLVIVRSLAPIIGVAHESVLHGLFPAGGIGHAIALEHIGAGADEPVEGVALRTGDFLIEDQAAGVAQQVDQRGIVVVHGDDQRVVVRHGGIGQIHAGVHGRRAQLSRHVLEREQHIAGGHGVAVGELHTLTQLDGQAVLGVVHLGGQLRRHVAVRIAGPQALAYGMNEEAAGVGLQVGSGVKGGGVGIGAVVEDLQTFFGFRCGGGILASGGGSGAGLGGGGVLAAAAAGQSQTQSQRQKQSKQTCCFLHVLVHPFILSLRPMRAARLCVNYKTLSFYCKTTKIFAPHNNLYCLRRIFSVKSTR